MQLTNDPFSSMLIRLFRPLVRLLLRFAVPYKSAAEALKWVYVDVATREFAIELKPQTMSRVAVITGMTRLEVERLQRELPRAMDTTVRMFHRAGRVINGWNYTPKYQDVHGKPQNLPLEGNLSFQSLVNDFAGGATMRAVLDELLRGGNVVLQSDGLYALKNLELLVSSLDQQEQLGILATAASDLIGTIERNLRDQQTDRYLQAYVHQSQIPLSKLPVVRKWVRENANRTLDEFDQLLTELHMQAHPDEPKVSRLGLGLYYFQDEPPPPEPKQDGRGRTLKSTKAQSPDRKLP